MLLGDPGNCRHVGRAAAHMHRHDGFGSACYRAVHSLRIEVQSARVHVYKHGFGAGHRNRVGRGDKSHVRNDYFVTHSNAYTGQRKVDRRRAARHRDRMPDPEQRGDLMLELLGNLALVDVVRIQHLLDMLVFRAAHLRHPPGNSPAHDPTSFCLSCSSSRAICPITFC